MHFLLTRPQEDAGKLGKSLKDIGHEVSYSPLLKIEYFDPQKVSLDNFQALVFTSVNGVRAYRKNSENRDIVCYTVGDATAAEAQNLGFKKIHSAAGNVAGLTQLICRDLAPEQGALLHISGKDIAGNLSENLKRQGFSTKNLPLYKAHMINFFPQDIQGLFRANTITHIPFYSPRTAKAFVGVIRAANLQDKLSEITALCLSFDVSDVISCLNWGEILIAPQPKQYSLFNLIDIKLEDPRV